MRNIIDEIYEYKEIKKRKRSQELLTVGYCNSLGCSSVKSGQNVFIAKVDKHDTVNSNYRHRTTKREVVSWELQYIV